MSTLVTELRKAIRASDYDWDEIARGMFGGYVPKSQYYKLLLELEALGFQFEAEDHHGGEGQGDQYWSVIKVTKGDEVAFIKFTGWYASFAGSEMSHGSEEFTEVKKVPVQSYSWDEV